MKKFTLFIITLFASSVIYFTLRSNTRPPHLPATAGTPFRLLNFDVKLQYKARIITWSDGDESDLDHFELQRSTSPDAPFVTLYSVFTQNNKNNSYAYTDDAAVAGNILYYRLVQVGKDGYGRYSNVLSVKTDIDNRVTLYPNPATDHISVSLGSVVKRADIKIVNQQGVVLVAAANFSGNNFVQDISKFSGGMYFVHITSENGVSTSSFIKK